MLYRVVNDQSGHYGQVGRRVSKEECRKVRGVPKTDPWITQWHIILDLDGVGNMGMGFWRHEVEFAGYKTIIDNWLRPHVHRLERHHDS